MISRPELRIPPVLRLFALLGLALIEVGCTRELIPNTDIEDTDFNRGVGLSNTRSRLDHLYGSLHRFEFRQPAEGGLLVCIAIPMAELASEVEEDLGHERRRTDDAVEGVA